MKNRRLFWAMMAGMIWAIACGDSSENDIYLNDEPQPKEIDGQQVLETFDTMADDTRTVLALAGIDRLLEESAQVEPTFDRQFDGQLPDLETLGLDEGCIEAELEAHRASLTLIPGCLEGSGSILLEQAISETAEILTLTVNVALPDQTIDGQLVVTRRIMSQTIELVALNIGGNRYSGSITFVRDALNHVAVAIDIDAEVDGTAILGSASADLEVTLESVALVGAADLSINGEAVADIDFDILMQSGCEAPDVAATAVIDGETYSLTSSCDGSHEIVVPEGFGEHDGADWAR